MIKAFLSMVMLALTVAASSQSWTRPEDAERSAGQVLNVLGLVTEVKTVSSGKQAGLHIKLAGKDVPSPLTIVIPHADAHKFEPVLSDLLNEYVHVKGKIYMKKGKAYVQVSSREQLSIAREMELKTFEPL